MSLFGVEQMESQSKVTAQGGSVGNGRERAWSMGRQLYFLFYHFIKVSPCSLKSSKIFKYWGKKMGRELGDYKIVCLICRKHRSKAS